jgi:hypothetical protein
MLNRVRTDDGSRMTSKILSMAELPATRRQAAGLEEGEMAESTTPPHDGMETSDAHAYPSLQEGELAVSAGAADAAGAAAEAHAYGATDSQPSYGGDGYEPASYAPAGTPPHSSDRVGDANVYGTSVGDGAAAYVPRPSIGAAAARAAAHSGHESEQQTATSTTAPKFESPSRIKIVTGPVVAQFSVKVAGELEQIKKLFEENPQYFISPPDRKRIEAFIREEELHHASDKELFVLHQDVQPVVDKVGFEAVVEVVLEIRFSMQKWRVFRRKKERAVAA